MTCLRCRSLEIDLESCAGLLQENDQLREENARLRKECAVSYAAWAQAYDAAGRMYGWMSFHARGWAKSLLLRHGWLPEAARACRTALDAPQEPGGGTLSHKCHARGCDVEVEPRLLMCPAHWNRVPKPLQRAVWRCYRAGQERTKGPSREYMGAQHAAIEAVARIEGRGEEP